MRPTDHTSTNYANDMASLSRMLRRVLTDDDLPRATRRGLEKSYREAIRLLSFSMGNVGRGSDTKSAPKKRKKRRTERAVPSPLIVPFV
jgi:hypothetical protein